MSYKNVEKTFKIEADVHGPMDLIFLRNQDQWF